MSFRYDRERLRRHVLFARARLAALAGDHVDRRYWMLLGLLAGVLVVGVVAVAVWAVVGSSSPASGARSVSGPPSVAAPGPPAGRPAPPSVAPSLTPSTSSVSPPASPAPAPSAPLAPPAPSTAPVPSTVPSAPAPSTAPPTAPSTAVPPPASATPPTATRVVVRGETLASIAHQVGVPFELIAAANHLPDPNRITTGQRLRIPALPAGVVLVAPGDTLSGLAHAHATTVAALRAANPAITDPDRVLAGSGLRLPPP